MPLTPPPSSTTSACTAHPLGSGPLLLRRRLAALPARGPVLRRGPALLGAPTRPALLATPLRGAGGVGDLGRPLLRHALVLERLVLLLVLDVGRLRRHRSRPPSLLVPEGPGQLGPPHLRAARQVPSLGLLVQLGPGLGPGAARPLAPGHRGALLAEGGAGLGREVGDRLLLPSAGLGLPHVALGRLHLLPRGHVRPPELAAAPLHHRAEWRCADGCWSAACRLPVRCRCRSSTSPSSVGGELRRTPSGPASCWPGRRRRGATDGSGTPSTTTSRPSPRRPPAS